MPKLVVEKPEVKESPEKEIAYKNKGAEQPPASARKQKVKKNK